MLIRIDRASSVALHEQIAGQYRHAIATGELDSGTKLPPARELAEGLDVNMHTLLRAFKALRDEGLVEMRRGRGTRVANNAPRLAEVSNLADQLVTAARRYGISDADLKQLVEVRL